MFDDLCAGSPKAWYGLVGKLLSDQIWNDNLLSSSELKPFRGVSHVKSIFDDDIWWQRHYALPRFPSSDGPSISFWCNLPKLQGMELLQLHGLPSDHQTWLAGESL